MNAERRVGFPSTMEASMPVSSARTGVPKILWQSPIIPSTNVKELKE